jgi:hypothetical protein
MSSARQNRRLYGRRAGSSGRRCSWPSSKLSPSPRSGERASPFDLPPPDLPEGARERAASLAAEVDRSPYGNGLGRPLADLVLTGMATDLARLRPKPRTRDLTCVNL